MADAVASFGLIALCCLLLPVSGWWLAARLRNESLFRFVAASLIGVTAIAVAELIAYVLHVPQLVAVGLVAAACAASLPHVIAAIRAREFAWDALLVWMGASCVLVAVTMNYAVHGGPGTLWDWYEHWLRSLIFLQQGPVDTMIGLYRMPARGPLFNGASALLMNLSGSQHYWVFQAIATTLNLLVCLAFALVLRTIGGLGRRTALLAAAAVVMVVPAFFWNTTFTWTKNLTAAFVLLGTHEYLVAWRNRDRNGMAMSLAYLAPGFFSHYLALLYAGLLGLHLLLVTPWRGWPIRALVRAGVVWALLVGTWFGFMIMNFGVKRTLGANTTVGKYQLAEDAQGNPVPFPHVFTANLCADIFPAFVCRPLFPPAGPPGGCPIVTGEGETVTPGEVPCPPASGLPRLPGVYSVMGWSGFLTLLVALAVSAKAISRSYRDDGWFLVWVIGAGLAVNLLPIRWFDPGGSFNENLHAWMLIVFAVVAAGLARLPRWALAVLLVAMAVEFGMADWNQIQAQTVPLPIVNHPEAISGHPPLGQFLPAPVSTAKFEANRDYYQNFVYKVRGGAIYFRDAHPDDFATASWTLLVLGLVVMAAGVGKSTSEKPAAR